MSFRLLATSAAVATLLMEAASAQAQCPVGTAIDVDLDIPGSGYSETSNNWTTWNTAPCSGPGYRYLSHTVGDGSRKGKAIWRPNITVEGYYRFETGYRATTNRTNDADFFSYSDGAMPVHQSIDQEQGSGCVWVDLGTFFCQPGGECRVELDGTDDSESDEADITRFTLVSCDAAPDAGGTGGTGGTGGQGRCDALRAEPAYEVCAETDTTCAGVYTDGSGCSAYCAAAGMTCTARFGGEPGCQKEPANPIPCDESNSHASDWCECSGPPLPPGTGGAAGTAGGAGMPGTGGATAGTSGGGGSGLVDAGMWPVGSDASAGAPSGSGGTGAQSRGDATTGDDGGCGCRVGARGMSGASAGLLAALALLASRRRRRSRPLV